MRDRLYKRGKKGVWWCRVRGRHGRVIRKSTRTPDYQAAIDVAAQYERAFATEDNANAEETTLESCVADYLADLARRGRSKATQKIAQQKTGHFLRRWTGKMPMARLTAKLVTEYIDARLAEGVERFTVKKELGHLRQIIRLARYHRVYHQDPETVLPPYFQGKHVPRKRWPTPAELHALLQQLHRHRAAHVAYMTATGARLGESYRALRSDADFDRRVVHIHGTKTEGADDDVPITGVNEGLLRWALANAPGKTVLFHPWGKIHRDLAAACIRAGIATVTPNDLRRAFGHWHRGHGVDVNLVSKMLRHTTDKLAQTTYAKLSGQEVAKLVNSALAGVPDLYQSTAETGPTMLQQRNESWEKQAPPGEIESPTNGLGNLGTDARSVGTKLGVLRARQRARVSNLYTRDSWGKRGPSLHEATSNLYELLALPHPEPRS